MKSSFERKGWSVESTQSDLMTAILNDCSIHFKYLGGDRVLITQYICDGSYAEKGGVMELDLYETEVSVDFLTEILFNLMHIKGEVPRNIMFLYHSVLSKMIRILKRDELKESTFWWESRPESNDICVKITSKEKSFHLLYLPSIKNFVVSYNDFKNLYSINSKSLI